MKQKKKTAKKENLYKYPPAINSSPKNPECLLFFKCSCDVHNLSLVISLRAFLPSFRLLRTNQEKEEIIKMLSTTREIKVVLIAI